MKPTKNISREAAKLAKQAVLSIGMQCFHFRSPAHAAEAFKLLSEATHVQRGYHHPEKFTPRELIGDLKVEVHAASAFASHPSPLRGKKSPPLRGTSTASNE